MEQNVLKNILPETGFLRLANIIGDAKASPPIPAILPVSKSTWWAGVKSGRYLRPITCPHHGADMIFFGLAALTDVSGRRDNPCFGIGSPLNG